VTEDGDVVWEYVNPIKRDGEAHASLNQGDDNQNGVFRAHRWGPNYPGLAGKDLRSGYTLTGRIPGTFEQYEPAPTGWGTGNKVGAGGGGGGAAAGAGSGGY